LHVIFSGIALNLGELPCVKHLLISAHRKGPRHFTLEGSNSLRLASLQTLVVRLLTTLGLGAHFQSLRVDICSKCRKIFSAVKSPWTSGNLFYVLRGRILGCTAQLAHGYRTVSTSNHSLQRTTVVGSLSRSWLAVRPMARGSNTWRFVFATTVFHLLRQQVQDMKSTGKHLDADSMRRQVCSRSLQSMQLHVPKSPQGTFLQHIPFRLDRAKLRNRKL